MSLFAVGSYTQHSVLDARGRGISVVEWDGEAGKGRVLDVFEGLKNPTYLAWVRDGRFLYSISEVDGKRAGVAAFFVDESGNLTFAGKQDGEYGSCCHLTAVPERERIYAASYGDGSLSVFDLRNGVPAGFAGGLYYMGSGPNKERQESPHAHQVMVGPGGFLYVCDLGSDCVWVHSPDDFDGLAGGAADEVAGGAVLRKALKVPAGYGPRHLLFDPVLPVAYVLCELKPKLLAASVDSALGEMTLIQEADTVDLMREGGAAPAPAAVKMHPSGKTLAVSNRFDDTIAVFDVHRSSGWRQEQGLEAGEGCRAEGQTGECCSPMVSLSLAGRFECGGKAPRDIEFDSSGRYLFIANQDSHNVSVRRFDGLTGQDAGEWAEGFDTGSPVCVLMLD